MPAALPPGLAAAVFLFVVAEPVFEDDLVVEDRPRWAAAGVGLIFLVVAAAVVLALRLRRLEAEFLAIEVKMWVSE